MKIRSGFVSNSSSTSFALWGISVPCDSEDYNKITKNYSVNPVVEYHCGIDDLPNDHYYIGLSPKNMRDDETLKMFKQRIADLIYKQSGIPQKPEDVDFFSDGGYDG